ncbi:hypothetical protein EV715DRAFT_246137, partial [Schizophyllum commune]
KCGCPPSPRCPSLSRDVTIRGPPLAITLPLAGSRLPRTFNVSTCLVWTWGAANSLAYCHDLYARYLPSLARKQGSCTLDKADNPPCSNPSCVDLRTRASPAPSRAASESARVVLQRYRARHDTHLPHWFRGIFGATALSPCSPSLVCSCYTRHWSTSRRATRRLRG